MTSAAPPLLAIEGGSAWIVMIAVSFVSLLGVLVMRRLINRPGRLASGLLLSLPLVLPLIAAVSFDHAAFPVVAVLRPVDGAMLQEPGALAHLLWSRSPGGGLLPYTLSAAAGSWMLWIGLSVVSFMLTRRVVGAVLVHRLIARCRPLDLATEGHVAAIVERLSLSIGLARIPRVVVMPDGISGAFVAGSKRPRILLSADMITGLQPDELAAILAHEISHIDAHDIGLTFTAGFLRDLVAWNPVAHVAFRRLMADREMEADRRAAEMTGDPLAVASGLLKACELRRLLPGRRNHFALAVLGGGSRIKRRVRMLLVLADGGSYVRGASNAPYLAAAVLVAALGLQAGASIAAQPDGAYLIGWGQSTEGSVEGFWAPAKRRVRQGQGKMARPPKRVKLMDLPQTYTWVPVKKKDVPRWLSDVEGFWRRAGLNHEMTQWQIQPVDAPGPFSVYRLMPGAV